MAHDFCMLALAALFPISKHSAILNTYMFRDQLVGVCLCNIFLVVTSLCWPIIHYIDIPCDFLRKEVFASLSLLATAETVPALSTV